MPYKYMNIYIYIHIWNIPQRRSGEQCALYEGPGWEKMHPLSERRAFTGIIGNPLKPLSRILLRWSEEEAYNHPPWWRETPISRTATRLACRFSHRTRVFHFAWQMNWRNLQGRTFFTIRDTDVSRHNGALNFSVQYCCDVRGVSGGPLIGNPWCREALASQATVRLIGVGISVGAICILGVFYDGNPFRDLVFVVIQVGVIFFIML